MSEESRRHLRAQTLKPLRAVLLPVPALLTGICTACRSGSDVNARLCGPCRQAERTLGALPTIVPITMSENLSQLHAVLRGYKDSFNAQERERKTRQLAALVATFFESHAACVGAFDLLVTVPSARRDSTSAIVSRIGSLTNRREAVLHPTRSLDHRDYDASAFRVDTTVRGRTVVLLDDTFTTGSAIYSAAAAVQAAGGEVVSGVVIGRHVNDWATNAPIMEWLRDLPWLETECCICGGAHPPGRLPL